jgi:hypothetical protein
MQSSTAVVFRALVMLACLVAIPLAAVVGKSLPDMVRGLVGGQWPGRSASACGPLTEAPRFVPGGPTEVRPGASDEQARLDRQQPQVQPVQVVVPDQAAPSYPTNSRNPLGQAGLPMGLDAVPAASVRAPGPVSATGPATRQPAVSGVNPAWGGGRPALVPNSTRAAVPRPIRREHPFGGPSGQAAQARSAGDQFTIIQGRLRELGATYYLLESWGSQHQLYRFYCKMAIGGNPNYTHYFEATDSEPLRAMARVLRQVETWRAGRP